MTDGNAQAAEPQDRETQTLLEYWDLRVEQARKNLEGCLTARSKCEVLGMHTFPVEQLRDLVGFGQF